ncbi:MAG: histidine phosphatase family protein [Lentisphaerales bacterium]|nr:histidine phosphatase family protein [Lentisphaerales bacterium]
MKRLAVMRHAEAGMASVDKHRQLTEHGLLQATESAEKLKDYFTPQLVLVSTAVRTRMTVEQVAKVYGWYDSFCTYEEGIYNASASALVHMLERLPDEYSDVLLIAHNPGVSSLVSSLTGGYGVGFSPATFALLEVRTDFWAELTHSAISIKRSYSPL